MSNFRRSKLHFTLSTHFKIVLRVFFVFLCAYSIFRVLYIYDNQYTLSAPQPINGLLSISEDELEHYPVRYLIRDWEYYPNALLTPDDFKAEMPLSYKKNIFIGQYATLNAGIKQLSVHGSGTYRLTLNLPKNRHLYALQLPEIFSSYHLYINDELYLTLGNPNPYTYTPQIHEQTLVFSAEGLTTLLIAVTGYEHLYSGIVHPIAFGTYQNISYFTGIKLLFRILILLVGISIGLPYIYFYFKTRQKQNLFFALLCFCTLGYTNHYLIHIYFTTGIQPWYSIELFCSYAMLALLVILINQICAIKNTFSRTITCILSSFSIFALLVSLFSGLLNPTMRSTFSTLCGLIKGITLFYLLIATLLSIKNKVTHANALLLGIIFFSIALGADLVSPVYEPIYTFHYNEIGGMTLAAIIGSILWKDLINGYTLHFQYLEDNKQIQRQLELQRSHYAKLNAKIQETRTIHHDLRQHMRLLNTLVNEENIIALKEYFKSYNATVSFDAPLTYCQNYAIDAILQYYNELCKQNHIEYTVSFSFPAKPPIPDTDFCIILGNLIENALEACQRQTSSPCFIKVTSQVKGNSLLICIQNSFDGVLHKHKNRFISSKRNELGIGTYSVTSLVERYGGMISFEAEQNVFCASIILFLASE